MPEPDPSDIASMLQNAARLARLGYWVWDHAADRGVFASEELADIYGLTPEGYLAELGNPQRLFDWFHPDDREAYRDVWFNKAKHGEPYEIEVRVYTCVGHVRHCREIGEPVFDAFGHLVRTVGTFQDVTEQRAREEQLAEVVAHSPAVVYSIEPVQPFTPRFLSPNVFDLTGYSAQRFLADPEAWVACVHPDDRDRVQEAFAKLCERGALVQEYRFLCADGGYRWLRDQVRVRRDGADGIVNAVGYVSDVTEMRDAEAARRASEARYRELFENAPFGLYRSSPDGRFLEVNPAMAQMFDCASPADFLSCYGDSVRKAYAEPSRREAFAHEIENGGKVRDVEWDARSADGRRLRISESARVVYDGAGNVVGHEGCVVDVSARHQAQLALAERVKELACLYDISEIRWDERRSLPDILQAVAERLPAAFQFPEICSAKITFERRSYSSEAFIEGGWGLVSAIRVGGELAGHIEVFYSRSTDGAQRSPFLLEEHQLLDRIADGLAASIAQRRTKAQAEEQAAMLREAAALAQLGFCVWDEENRRVVEFSEELPAIFGLTSDAYRRQARSLAGVLELVHADDRALYHDFLTRCRTPSEPHQLEYRVVQPDGSARSVREIVDPVVDEDGRVRRSVCTVQDVTDFKVKEAALRATTAFLEAQRKASPLAIVAMDRRGRVISWNPAAERMFGWREEETLGRISPGVTPEERDVFFARLSAVLNGRRVQVFESVRQRKDGSRFEARIHGAPLMSESGEPEGALALYEDVTDQARIRRELEASERRFRTVTDVLPIPVAITEQDTGRVLFANPEVEKLFGIQVADVGKVHALDFYNDPADRDRMRAEMTRTGRVKGFECQMRDVAGGLRWISITGEQVEFDGEAAYCMAPLDITERKRMEAELRRHETLIRQSQKMESLGTLAGGIAHDFNNVLQPIVMFTEDAADVIPADSPAQRSLRNVLDSAERAVELVRQILDFCREEARSDERHDIHDLVSGAVRLVRRTIPSSVTIEADLDPATGVCGVSPSDVTQIVTNLAANAGDAMDGKGALRIALGQAELIEPFEAHGMRLSPGVYACLSVEDTGPGMPAWLVDRIFEPFFTTKEVGRGTGLGLAVVHGLVRQHDGAVRVATAPGEGARFDIYLPLLPEEDL